MIAFLQFLFLCYIFIYVRTSLKYISFTIKYVNNKKNIKYQQP